MLILVVMMGIGAMEGSVGKAQVERRLDCDAAGRRQRFQRSPLARAAKHGNII